MLFFSLAVLHFNNVFSLCFFSGFISRGVIIIIGPRRDKTFLRGFRQSEIQTSLISYRD